MERWESRLALQVLSAQFVTEPAQPFCPAVPQVPFTPLALETTAIGIHRRADTATDVVNTHVRPIEPLAGRTEETETLDVELVIQRQS